MKAEPTHENEGIGGTSGQDGTVTVLTSSQDSINIATELQNSHHQESPEKIHIKVHRAKHGPHRGYYNYYLYY